MPRRILILAPHPDDEIVACGIAARRARAAGAAVFVLFLTAGVPAQEALWPWQRRYFAARVERRRNEALRSTALCGIEPVGFLTTPSRHLRHGMARTVTEIARAIAASDADALWVPAFEGAHQDHDAANALAASFVGRLQVLEFAAYNFAGGKIRSNVFAASRNDETSIAFTAEEAVLKREALACYRSERGNLQHIATLQESWRPLPAHDYGSPPHAGTLFRERFHWVPFRHPRVDFDASATVYSDIAQWRRNEAAQAVRHSSAPVPLPGEV